MPRFPRSKIFWWDSKRSCTVAQICRARARSIHQKNSSLLEESLSYFSLSSVEAGGKSTLTASSVSRQQGVVFHVQDQQQDNNNNNNAFRSIFMTIVKKPKMKWTNSVSPSHTERFVPRNLFTEQTVHEAAHMLFFLESFLILPLFCFILTVAIPDGNIAGSFFK